MPIPSVSDPQDKRAEEYLVEALTDGALRVVHLPKRRIFYFWLLLFAGVLFLSVTTILAGEGVADPSVGDGFQWHKVAVTLHDVSNWGLSAFMLLSVFLICSAFCWLAGWEEWRVTQSLIEVRYYFLRLRYHTCRYTSGRITVERSEEHNSETNEVTGYSWWLCVRTDRRRGVLSYSQLGKATPDDDLRHIAELLSRQTGWELSPYPSEKA